MQVAIDNDILFKGAGYGLLSELVSVVPANVMGVGVLGAARFVVFSKLTRSKISAREAALGCFRQFIECATILEPTREETGFAAELEFTAQKDNLDLDPGESLLCAIVIKRKVPWLATGDKRAIQGIERVLTARGEVAVLKEKVICMEQLVLRVLEATGAPLRSVICKEPSIDRALTICFSCHSSNIAITHCHEGLKSYITHLRIVAKTILAI